MLKFVLDFINFMLEINKEWTEANRHRRRETLPHALWGCAVAGSLLSGCDRWGEVHGRGEQEGCLLESVNMEMKGQCVIYPNEIGGIVGLSIPVEYLEMGMGVPSMPPT